MRRLLTILRVARRSFRGKLPLRFAMVIAMAVLTGFTTGVLPAVIGHVVGALAGRAPGAATAKSTVGVSRWIVRLVPAQSPWLLVLLTLLATIVTVAIGVYVSKLSSALSGDVTAALRVEMMGAVLRASARDVEAMSADITSPRRPPGMSPPPGKAAAGATREAVVRLAVSREAAMVSDFMVSVLTGLLQSFATLVVLTIELVSSDAWLVLVGGGALFVTSRLLADRASKRVGVARQDMQTADAAVFGLLHETLAATEDLRLWGAREQVVTEFAEVAYGSAAAREKFAAALAAKGQIKRVFMAMAPLLIVVALKLAGRPYDAGEVAKLLLLVPLLMVRLEALDGIRQGFIEREPIIAATQKLLALRPAPARAAHAQRLVLADVRGDVSFKNVTFAPPSAARAIIREVTLDIAAGDVVGICGPSGSGKSTLLRLLLRLDEPSHGNIAVDRIAVRDIEPQQLPQLFGVVRQTSRLLQRAVRDNLTLGLVPPPSAAAVRQAITAVKMDALVDGDAGRDLSTVYRQNPPNFSGGEVRRLLIARMLLGGSPISVLDEPEAGLPSATAEDILEAVVAQAQGRTVIVVTHAPHLLRSDYNVVLQAGRVVDVGPHEQLLARCGVYRELLADALQPS